MAFSSWVAHKTCGPITCSLILFLAALTSAAAADGPRDRNGQAAFAEAALPAHGPGTEGASLDHLIAEALQNNPEVRAARNEHEAALQRISPAGALDDPMIEMGVLNLPVSSFGFNREDMTMKMLGLSQRLPYPGKRALKRDVAPLDSESVALAYSETVNRVIRNTRLAYYDFAVVTASMRLIDQNRAIVRQLIKVADTRYSVGQANQVDVLRAQTQLSRMSEELLKLEREYNLSAAELGHALGRPTSAGAIQPLLGLREENLDFTKLRDEALDRRPQLLALKKISERSERAVELARTERYPDFDVRFSYGQRDSMPDGTRRSDLVSVTVAMNLPVWRQTKTQPKIAEAIALQERAESMLEAQSHETYRILHQQIAMAEQSLKAVRLYRNELIPQSRLIVEAATAAYQVGRSDFALLLDNQMSVLNLQLAEVTAIANYNKALAEIDFIAGRTPAELHGVQGVTR
jgi:outer membrane protein TolC